MRKLLSGLALVALVAGAANAKPGGGHGNGGDKHGGGNPHAVAQGGGGGKGHGNGKGQAQDRKLDRGPAMNPGNQRAERGPKPQAKDRGQAQRRVERVDREAGPKPGRRADRHNEGQASPRDRQIERQVQRDRRGAERRGPAQAFDASGAAPRFAERRRSPIDGCPPGLAKKYNGCMPPGLARQQSGIDRNTAVAAAGTALLVGNLSPSWFGYDDYGPDYRYADGYLLRTGDNRVLSYVPLVGGALAPGEPWLPAFQPAPIPAYWTDYYDLGRADRYRYYGDAIYEVDPGASQIEQIVALLAGDRWAVGQPMPYGYDVYNVPYAYRARYVDGPGHWYRYADGYVYDVDPATRLVAAIIQLLT
jgi:hypothetical protein